MVYVNKFNGNCIPNKFDIKKGYGASKANRLAVVVDPEGINSTLIFKNAKPIHTW